MDNFFFNNELMILETKPLEVSNIKDIINHYEMIYNDCSFTRNLKVLIDCRDIQLEINVDEISLTHKIVEKTLLKYTHISEAILVDTPHKTVITTLFKNINSDFKTYDFKIFSTRSAAISWLLTIN